jgi:hypothetical protein
MPRRVNSVLPVTVQSLLPEPPAPRASSDPPAEPERSPLWTVVWLVILILVVLALFGLGLLIPD